MRFVDMPWHDAELRLVSIDRSRPGLADQVDLEIRWPDGTRGRVRFEDCYGADLSMHFGIVCSEAILTADEHDVSPRLEAIRKQWHPHVDLSRLRAFRIETSSTASVITVFAMSWSIGPFSVAATPDAVPLDP